MRNLWPKRLLPLLLLLLLLLLQAFFLWQSHVCLTCAPETSGQLSAANHEIDSDSAMGCAHFARRGVLCTFCKEMDSAMGCAMGVMWNNCEDSSVLMTVGN